MARQRRLLVVPRGERVATMVCERLEVQAIEELRSALFGSLDAVHSTEPNQGFEYRQAAVESGARG